MLAPRAKIDSEWVLMHAPDPSGSSFRYRKNKNSNRDGTRTKTHPASVLAQSANTFFRYLKWTLSSRLTNQSESKEIAAGNISWVVKNSIFHHPVCGTGMYCHFQWLQTIKNEGIEKSHSFASVGKKV